MGIGIEGVLARLDKVSAHGEGQWMARCPAHDDRTPSLSVSAGRDGAVLLKCFAGCETRSVVAALGLQMGDLFERDAARPARPKPYQASPARAKPRLAMPAGSRRSGGGEGEASPGDNGGGKAPPGDNGGGARKEEREFSLAGLTPGARWNLGREPREFVEWYDYQDAEGRVVYRKLRFRNVDGPGKTFVQCVPVGACRWRFGRSRHGVGEVLYKLPMVREAVAQGWTLWIVEGEKDAEALEALGLPATCNADGAGKWSAALAEELRGAARVVIVADRDESEEEAKRRNPKARAWEQGQRHASEVLESLRALGVPCVCMMLPAEVNGWAVKDVSDWIVARGEEGAAMELEALAAAAPEWDSGRYLRGERREAAPLPHPAAKSSNEVGASGEEYDAAVLRRWLIEAMTDKDASGHVKKRNMCQAVCAWLRARGRFFYDLQDRGHGTAMWFDSVEKRLHRVSQDYFRSWLARESAFNRDLRDFKLFISAVEDESLVGDETRGIEPRRYWHREGDVVYLSSGEGRMVRVDAAGVTMVDNGTDGVVFEQGYALEEWELAPEDQARDPFEECRVFSQISTVDGRGLLLVKLWFMGMFGSVGWKPLLVLSGDVGSGKTRVATAMFELLGLMPRVTAIDGIGNIKDFWVSVDKGGLFCLDNADHHISWLPDALSVISTGGTFEKKKLYTDMETITQRARCWAVVTSANPSFASDAGLSDRLITVLLERVQRDSSERELAREIAEVREAGLSWICYKMRAALADREAPPRAMNRRHPDWAEWVWRLGKAAGKAVEAEAAVRENEAYKATFSLQNDALGRYLLHACQGGWRGSAEELAKHLAEECEGFNAEQWTVAKIGRALARLKVALNEIFRFQKLNHSGRAVYVFEPATDPETCDDGARGELPHVAQSAGEGGGVDWSIMPTWDGEA